VLSFPFSQENPKGPERTHQDTIEDAKQAMLMKQPCYGVKGPSWLAGLEHYDIIKGTGIDYMHAVLLGNMKKAFVWPQTSNSKYSLSRSFSG
jgi:hypothetical protein